MKNTDNHRYGEGMRIRNKELTKKLLLILLAVGIVSFGVRYSYAKAPDESKASIAEDLFLDESMREQIEIHETLLREEEARAKKDEAKPEEAPKIKSKTFFFWFSI